MKNSKNNNIVLVFGFMHLVSFYLMNRTYLSKLAFFRILNSFPSKKRKQLGHSNVGAAASKTVFYFAKSRQNHGLASLTFCGGSDIGTAKIEMNTRKEGC